MNSVEFNIARLSSQLENLINKTYQFLDENGQGNQKEFIAKELDSIKNREQLKVAFVGQYSSGKSTIISALTGNRGIKIDANVATDVVKEYRWHNITLMDTPGILAGKYEEHDFRTKNALKECDLIVYVLTSQLFDSIIFNNFIDLAYNQQFKDKMLIAVNKMSMEAGEFEVLVTNYRESLTNTFHNEGYKFDFDVVFMDAADYLEGRDNEDEEFIELSNFHTFVKTLNSFVDKKGIIKKQFDTPVRLLKSYISDIQLSAISPEIGVFNEQYKRRITKSLRGLERQVKLLILDFEQSSLMESNQLISMIGDSTEDEINNESERLTFQIEKKTEEINSQIEKLVEDEYEHLAQEIEDFRNKDALKLYRDNLELKIGANGLSNEEKSNLNTQKNILNFISGGAKRVGKISSIDAVKGLGKVSDFSGSTLHETVKRTGHFFGKKFKPWEAVKITRNIGNVAKFGVPVLVIALELGFSINEERKEEKKRSEIKATKNQQSSEIRLSIKNIADEIEKQFNDIVIQNYREKLNEVEELKISIINAQKKNEGIRNYINTLESEYAEFIEIIEKS